ncbi:Uncharacterised protein [uncultured archaeon]|nr:Uncharacterised protein [uncultured archaeon]
MTKKGNKSFWHTLPGILTGIAGIIGAIATLWVALHSYGSVSPTPSPTLITITSPKEGDKVQGYSMVTGTIRGELLEGQYMRIISNIQSIPGAWWPQGGAIKPQNGFWNAEVWLGFDEIDAGKNFTIAVILVNEDDNKNLVKYGEEARITGKYDPISFPNNATIMDKVTVTRI